VTVCRRDDHRAWAAASPGRQPAGRRRGRKSLAEHGDRDRRVFIPCYGVIDGTGDDCRARLRRKRNILCVVVRPQDQAIVERRSRRASETCPTACPPVTTAKLSPSLGKEVVAQPNSSVPSREQCRSPRVGRIRFPRGACSVVSSRPLAGCVKLPPRRTWKQIQTKIAAIGEIACRGEEPSVLPAPEA